MLRRQRIEEIRIPDLNLHWGAVLRLRKRMSREEYLDLCRKIFEKNEKKIREKRFVQVCFVTTMETAWSGDRLYRLLEESGRFRPFIAVADTEAEKRPAEERKEYYLKRGLNAYTLRELGDPDADLFVYQNPYPLPDIHADIRERKLSALCMMIPYAVMFFGSSGENYLESQWFMRSQCMWRFYCYTKFQLEQGRENNLLGSINMAYSGYPKTDILLTGSFRGGDWNFKTDAEKRILYAPSLYWEYSTFMQSWKIIYDLAEEFQDIAWIFRPHPYLGHTLVREGQIPSIAVYDQYLEKWKKLKNARVQNGGDYYDTIMTSDAMIADGTSLITNYQYTGKPLLVLTGEKMQFSEYGRELLSAQYTASGDDAGEIRNFVSNVVSKGMDGKLKMRKQFFDRNLNYQKENGKLASEFIYNDIVNRVGS